MLRKSIFYLLISLTFFDGFAQELTDQKDRRLYSKSKAFRKNVGQWESNIKYQALQGHKNIWILEDGLSFGISKATPFDLSTLGGKTDKEIKKENIDINPKIEYFVWNVNFLGMNKDAQLEDYNSVPGKYNYFNEFTGPDGVLKVPETNHIKYKELYKDIDLEFLVKDGRTKYNFILKSQANPKDILLNYKGIEHLSINNKGELLIHTVKGVFKESKPISFLNNSDGSSKQVEVKYQLIDDKTLTYTFDFTIGPNETLIIDPIYLDWATYFVGKKDQLNWSWTWITDVDIDENDQAYSMGITGDKFPVKPGVYDSLVNGQYDIFLCRMMQDGSDIDYFTYIGGSQYEYSYSMAATDDGKIYIFGTSNSKNFPTTVGSLKPKKTGTGYSNFILGINQTGSKLIYSTYLCAGVNSWWNSTAVDVNEQGEVIIALNRNISCFPETHKINFTTNKNVFGQSPTIIQLNAKGSKVIKSTVFGGDGIDNINGIYINKKNEVYFCGNTTSTNLYTHFGPNFYGKQDAIMVKIDSLWKKSLMLKYVGGTETDNLTSIYGDGEFIWSAGISNSNSLPRLTNKTPGGYANFALKMTESGMHIFWSTFINGGNWWGSSFNRQSVTANVKGEAYIVGNTSDASFATTKDALHKTLSGMNDAFIAKLDDRGKLIYGTYYGGNGWDYFYGTQAKKIGCVTYIVAGGYTTSSDFPTTSGSWIPKHKTNTTGWWNSGALIKLRDTLKVVDIDIGKNQKITQCNRIFRYLTAGNPGARYKWNDGDTNRIFRVDKPGKYWVNATYGCGEKSDTVEFFLKFGPQDIHLGNDTLMCGAFNIKLDAKNDTIKERSYLWSNGDTTQTSNFDTVGIKWVRVSTKRCGVKTDTIKISRLKYIDAHLGEDTTYCSDFKRTLNVQSDSATYTWNTKDSTPFIEIDKPGTYNVLIQNFCGATIEEIIIKRDSAVQQFHIEDSVFCDSVQHSIQIDGQPKTTIYKWSTGDSLPSATINKSGKYWVNYSNICGNLKDSFEFTILNSPIAKMPKDTQFCDKIELTLFNSNNSAVATWLPENIKGNSYTINKKGKYLLKLTNKCASSLDSMNVFLVKSPSLVIGNDSLFCDVINYTIKPKGIFDQVSFKWSDGSTDTNLFVNKANKYTLTVTNACNSVSKELNYTLKNTPIASLRKDTAYCTTFVNTSLDATNYNKIGINYLWSTGEITPKIIANKPGIYYVKTYNECSRDSTDVELILSQIPNVNLGIDTAFCGPLNYFLDAGTDGTSYIWTPTNETTSSIYAQKYGIYNVKVTNQYGCINRDQIEFKNKCDTRLYMANAFSPDDNGRNEMFGPITNDVLVLKFEIYNRWGEVIFSTTEIGKLWDGTFKNQPCEQGVYMWKVYYEGQREQKSKSGSVTLLR